MLKIHYKQDTFMIQKRMNILTFCRPKKQSVDLTFLDLTEWKYQRMLVPQLATRGSPTQAAAPEKHQPVKCPLILKHIKTQ